MKSAVAVALLLAFSALAGAADRGDDAALAHARKLLDATILVDGHNDLPWEVRTNKAHPMDVDAYDLRTHVTGQTDLARLKAGRVGAQFWSVYIPGDLPGSFARRQLEQIDIARRIIARYPETLRFATSVADIRAAKRAGRIASLLGMEGGHAIENSLGALRAYYDLGVRYMTLTHNVNLEWADCAAQPPAHGGLTEFGEAVVLEMNRLGMLVDLSHVSDGTMDDALRVSKAPVIFSHSSARAVGNVPRNVPDDILKRLPANGGVVMVTFVANFIDPQNPQTTIAKVADHIEHIRQVAGVQHVGIGGDFDGNDVWPEGLNDVSTYPNLFAELIRRGWSDRDLKLLAGENVLRVFEQAERVAQQLQRQPRT